MMMSLKVRFLDLWSVMNKSIYNGMQNTGKIDNNLNLKKEPIIFIKNLLKIVENMIPWMLWTG